MSRVIVLDPGHGGRDPGAIGPSGLLEKEVTLAVSKRLAIHLSPIADVHLTRWVDKALCNTEKEDLNERCKIANSLRATLFISLHCDSYSDPRSHGATVYTLPGQGP
ncbi:N-acetylmuramoyl-L-alanine amidase [Neomoorella humiferrea]|uniref:N-acetylmuramoyl-L-alanine amidase family protein n=1 Tax=Neomoorella humiferrea TaxID=676965 RepID=UPI003D925D36